MGCLVILFFVLCVVSGLGLTAFYLVPNAVEQQFGAPSGRLGLLQLVNLEWQLLSAQTDLQTPLDAQGTEKQFTITMGESAVAVAQRLQEAGLVRSADNFRAYIVYKGYDTAIQAGEYVLSPRQSAVEIAQALQDATPQAVEFNVLAGWRVEEIARSLPTSGLSISPEGFMQLVANPPRSALPAGGLPIGWDVQDGLEGLLLPGSYRLARSLRADELAREMVTQFEKQVTKEMIDGYASRGLSLREAVILASIVQREAVISDEQSLIASVFYNRIAAGMKLESDPTVQYAIGFNSLQKTWWTNPLSLEDLRVDSPYNTYQAAGLPPGPICNPSLSALRAVAYPAQTPYFYFRAACDGSGKHNFSKTFEEHLQKGCP